METLLNCDNCYWSGFVDELETATTDPDDQDFCHCPYCGGTEFEEEDVDDDGRL